MTSIDNCSICFYPLTQAVSLNCTHLLHLTCLVQLATSQWGREVSASCPLCRERITHIGEDPLPTNMSPGVRGHNLVHFAAQNNLQQVSRLLLSGPVSSERLREAAYCALPMARTDQIMEILFIAMSPLDRGATLQDAATRGGTSLFPTLMKIEPIEPAGLVAVATVDSAKHMSPMNRGAALIYALNRGHRPVLAIIAASGPILVKDLQTAGASPAAQNPENKAILDQATVVTE